MKGFVRIMEDIKKLLFLQGTQAKGSILSRKIKVSKNRGDKYKQGASSVLSTRIN